MSKKILITTAWPYVNGTSHLGHLAGNFLPADYFAKFKRLQGRDVLMVSGSDCHGTPTTLQAQKENVSPQDIVDKYHPEKMELMEKLDIEHNLYTTTTTQNHKEIVQNIFLRLLENGYIKKQTSKQYYSPGDNRFLPDRYVEGECSYCGGKEQRSDQCEECGRMLEPGELVNPYSKISESKVELKETEHYFILLDKLQPKIKKFLEGRQSLMRNWIYKEAMGWLNDGLQPRAITRDLEWGIDLPNQKIPPKLRLKNADKKCFYVWFEAVIGYLSASVEWSKKQQEEIFDTDVIYKVFSSQSKNWKDWWINTESTHYYFAGQDNLVFHTIMWPGILLGLDQDYTLPTNVVINKFHNYEGKAFSKSRNWIIDPIKTAKTYSIDSVRFHIATTLAENKEANFMWEDFHESINKLLVGKIGNLVHRTLSFINSRFDGELTTYSIKTEYQQEITKTFAEIASHFDKADEVKAINRVMKHVDYVNKYFDDKKVWEVVKEDREETEKILFTTLIFIANLRVMLYPFIPNFSRKVGEYLNLNKLEYKVGKNYWDFVQPFEQNIKIEENIVPIFEKIDSHKKNN